MSSKDLIVYLNCRNRTQNPSYDTDDIYDNIRCSVYITKTYTHRLSICKNSFREDVRDSDWHFWHPTFACSRNSTVRVPHQSYRGSCEVSTTIELLTSIANILSLAFERKRLVKSDCDLFIKKKCRKNLVMLFLYTGRTR